MELYTVSKVSKDYGISTRMLRYYEQAGLIKSLRTENYAYRVYDENALIRLRQIIVLRKLRVSVKQIISIFNSPEAVRIVEIFRQNISMLDEEITALSKIKSILTRFAEEINEKADVNLKLLGDETIFNVINSFSFSDNQIKTTKEYLSMEELNKANETVNKLSDKDVRIIYLPPATVASIHSIGGDPGPETISGRLLHEFIKNSNLAKIKPDFRHYGFNNSPEGADLESENRGYERWVTIPDDMEVSMPFVKKQFEGGIYAAFMIPLGDFHQWEPFYGWVCSHEKYEVESGRWFLEEHLNYINMYMLPDDEEFDKMLQLDLLIPIKKK